LIVKEVFWGRGLRGEITMDSQLLSALLGAIGTLVVLKLHEAQDWQDYARVVVLAIAGALAILILAYAAFAISRM